MTKVVNPNSFLDRIASKYRTDQRKRFTEQFWPINVGKICHLVRREISILQTQSQVNKQKNSFSTRQNSLEIYILSIEMLHGMSTAILADNLDKKRHQ